VRWMVSHAIHCYPQLFESDCAPVCCSVLKCVAVCYSVLQFVAEGETEVWGGFDE